MSLVVLMVVIVVGIVVVGGDGTGDGLTHY